MQDEDKTTGDPVGQGVTTPNPIEPSAKAEGKATPPEGGEATPEAPAEGEAKPPAKEVVANPGEGKEPATTPPPE